MGEENHVLRQDEKGDDAGGVGVVEMVRVSVRMLRAAGGVEDDTYRGVQERDWDSS